MVTITLLKFDEELNPSEIVERLNKKKKNGFWIKAKKSRYDEKEVEVYDISVEKYHNFAIDGGIFVHKPAVPTAYFLQIVFALILGYVMYKMKANFGVSTIIAIIFLATSIIAAVYFPFHASYKTWMVVFLLYIILAAAIPVNILLQPRD